MKKFLAVILCLTIVMGVLAGCTPRNTGVDVGTQESTEDPTVKSTEKETDKSTEAPTTQKPTSGGSENPTEPSTGGGSENPTEPSTGSGSENPTEPSTGSGTENPTEPSTGSGSENPTEPSTGSGSENPTEPSTGSGSENPTEPSTGSGTENPTEPNEPVYTLIYKGGDGSTGMTPTAVRASAGEKIMLAENTFIKSGFTFTGWSDGTDIYASGDEFIMPARDVEMTAQWQEDVREQITISFNTMEGSDIDSITVGKGEDSSQITLPQAYKEGFIFTEWFIDEALTMSFYENIEKIENAITLYAGYYEVNKKETTYLSTGESSLTSQDPSTAIMIDSFGVELTQENYTDYITVTNNYAVKETPNITIEQSEGVYLLKADPAWPTGGNFYIEAKDPVKIIVESEDENGELVELAVTKLLFTIHVGENHLSVKEKSHIITINPEDYIAYADDRLYLTMDFAFNAEIYEGKILKVFDDFGDFEYLKVGGIGSETLETTTAVVVHTIAPSLNEIYNDFKLSYTEDNINSADYLETVDEQEVADTLSQSEGLLMLQNMSLAMVADYAVDRGFANVSGIELNDGTMIMNEKAAAGRGGIYNPIAVIYKQEYGIDKEKGEIYGTWYIQLRGVDQQAKVHVGFGINTDLSISADGDCDIDVDVNWPWDDKFIDVSADIWFDVYVKHNQSISFTFDIVYYNKGVEYDVREHFQNNDPYDYPDNFAQKYKELINMGNRDIPIFSIDLFVFKIDILQIINVRIPIGVELTMSVNGSFSVETSSHSIKYYGIKGDINKGFESYSGETYCSTRTTVYYNGTFGVMAGVYVAVDLSILNLSKLGSVGVEVGFGVYYDFYGYGYTTTWYQKKSADSRYEKDVTEIGGTDEVGAAFSELGLYFKIGIYAKSDIFKVKVEATEVFKIPLVQTGDRYLLLDFTDEIKEYAKNGIVFGDDGFNIYDLGLHYYKYLDLREGDEVVRICAEIPDNKPLTLENLARYGEFNLQSKGMVIVDNETGDVDIAERYLGKQRASTNIYLYGYIGGYEKPDGSNVLSLIIPLHYVPDSFGLDPDKVGETVHVTFMVDDKVYHEEDVEYGYTLLMWNYMADPDVTTPIDIMYGSKGASDEFYAANPEYRNIRWRSLDFNVVLTEDRVIVATFDEMLVRLTYRYIEGVSSSGTPVWASQQIAVHRNTMLYDVLPELSNPGENIVLNASANWNVANKKIDFSDEDTVIMAQYEYKPVTLTVNVDAYETNHASVPAATYTYELTAGDVIFSYVNQHQSVFYKSYGERYQYGVWWKSYIEEGLSTTTKIWQDSTYNIRWIEQKLPVTVYDHDGNVLVHREVEAITDQSGIMEEDAVKNIAKTYKDENGITWVFKGWLNTSMLSRVDHALTIIPMYEKGTHMIKLDPNGGRFDYASTDGDGCFYWEITSGDIFAPLENYHRVLRDSTNTEAYTFGGWYYINDLGEKVFAFDPVLEDITYYADWTTDERTWDIVIHATGSTWDEEVLGTFTGEDTDVLTFKKNYADTNEIIEAVLAGDYSMLPTPTAVDENYSFVKWYVVEFVGKSFELHPFYQNNGTALVIVDIGEGRMYRDAANDDYVTGQFTITFTDGETWGLANWNGWQPAGMAGELPYAYSEETGTFEWLTGACYEDEHYLYTFEGWETSDGQTSWTFETDQVVTITAIYKQHYKRLTTRFSVAIDAADPEEIDDGVDYGAGKVFTYRDIYSKYGDVLDPASFPVATKTIGNDPYDDSLWHYVFDHWECVETGKTEVALTVTGNSEYRAVFRKEYRRVTMTFDAGENAVFPSTGERYFSVTVNRGTNFGELATTVENPVRTDGTTYEFLEWGGYADVYDIMYDSGDNPAPALWWNTERQCNEGEEDMIQIILDTGDDDAVFENSGTRYYTVMFEQGTTLVDSMFWRDDLADNEWPVGYLSNFVIIIDGEGYVGVYDIELPFDMNMDNDRTVLTVKELIPYAEWEAMNQAEYETQQSA